MRRFRIVGPLLLLAACKGGDGTGPEKIAKIVITPGQAVLTAAGATQQFTAKAVNENGAEVPGVVVGWRSSNASIATVDAKGLATAVFEGSASIVAEADGVSGQSEVWVDIPNCTTPQIVRLQPGGVLATDPPASASCALTLPSGAFGDRYRVAIVRLSAAVDATQTPTATLRLTPRGVIAAAGTPPSASVLSGPVASARESALLDAGARRAAATEAAHLRLRAAEQELLRRVSAFERLAPPAALATDGPLPVSPAKRTFLPRAPSDLQCSTAKTPVTGVLVAQNAAMAIYQDSALAQPVSAANAQRMLDFYARYGKATIDAYFGEAPDQDGNGQVVVLATTEVADPVAAFVWGGDQLSKKVCPASNEAELVYFNPGLIAAIARSDFQAIETVVHEVKHIISFRQRLSGAFAVTQPGWIEEGTAEIAGEAASRRGWAENNGPRQNERVTLQSFQRSGLTAENWGIALRVVRTAKYLATQPNAVVIATSPDYSIYGSGWHFHRFLGDAYGGAGTAPAADAPLFLQQNQASTPAGPGGLQTVTQKSYAELMVEYAAAVALNGTGAPQPARSFTTYDFPSAISYWGQPTVPPGRYPYPVTTASFGTAGTWSGAIGNGGLRIHEFVSNGTGTGAEIIVQVEPPARVVVARLR